MHPSSNVHDGEALIKQVYETIRNSPVWNQSMFVLVFDEHGGIFDHVIPPGAQVGLYVPLLEFDHHERRAPTHLPEEK
jgi:phospholipase C